MPGFAQQCVKDHHLVRRTHFRDHQPGWRRFGFQDRVQILDAEPFAYRIDAYQLFDAVLCQRLFKQRQRVAACLCLVIWRNAVFKFDTDHIRAAGKRLGKHVGAQSRRKDKAAARADL